MTQVCGCSTVELKFCLYLYSDPIYKAHKYDLQELVNIATQAWWSGTMSLKSDKYYGFKTY